MDFYCQIEVSEWVKSVLLDPIADVTSSILGEACASFSRPFVDLCEEVVQSFDRVGFRYLDVGCSIGEVVIQRPANVLIGVNTDWS